MNERELTAKERNEFGATLARMMGMDPKEVTSITVEIRINEPARVQVTKIMSREDYDRFKAAVQKPDSSSPVGYVGGIFVGGCGPDAPSSAPDADPTLIERTKKIVDEWLLNHYSDDYGYPPIGLNEQYPADEPIIVEND